MTEAAKSASPSANEPVASAGELDLPIIPHKAQLIDEAIARYGIKSIVDLGACWGVNGGYTFHALASGMITRAVLVDGRMTGLTRKRAAAWPQLELVVGDLGDSKTVERIGQVDAAVMFDIVLHQVSPNWDEFLRQYSYIDTLIIHNQNWLGPRTVRFVDEFDVDEYLARVYSANEARIRQWYKEHDLWCDKQRRPWRDAHNFWQWGITQKDLVGLLWDLGYRVDYLFSKGTFDARWPEIEIVDIIARKRNLPHPYVDHPVAVAAPSAEGSGPAVSPTPSA